MPGTFKCRANVVKYAAVQILLTIYKCQSSKPILWLGREGREGEGRREATQRVALVNYQAGRV